MRFANRTAIVTGAASGIGFACAGQLLDEGASVVFADIDEGALAEAMDALPREFSKRAAPVVCDVANPRQVEALVAYAIQHFGALDTLVTAAAVVHRCPFSEFPEDEFDRILDVNLKGTFLCVQAAGRQMAELRDRERDILGSIVTLSNDDAFNAVPHVVPHVMAAGGIDRMTRALARGLSSYNVRINTVAVGLTDTPMLRQATGTGKTAIGMGMARTAQSRVAEPDEVARFVAFLASAEASAITGQIIGMGAD